MKPGSLIGIFALMQLPATLPAAEWIGLDEDEPIIIGIALGQDESDNLTQTFNIAFDLGDSAGFDGNYANTKISDDRDEFDSLALSSSIWLEASDNIALELEHLFEGSSGELEKESLAIALRYSGQTWQLRLQLVSGELLVFTRDEIFDLFSTTLPDRISSDVNGEVLSIGQDFDSWYWQAMHSQFDYDKDVSLLSSSPFLQFIIEAPALMQTSLLLDSSSAIQFGYSDDSNDYAITLSRDRSATDNKHSDAILLSLNHWSQDDSGYRLAFSLPVESDSMALSLGLQWAL